MFTNSYASVPGASNVKPLRREYSVASTTSHNVSHAEWERPPLAGAVTIPMQRSKESQLARFAAKRSPANCICRCNYSARTPTPAGAPPPHHTTPNLTGACHAPPSSTPGTQCSCTSSWKRLANVFPIAANIPA
jgi:hypothetical protein